MSYLEELLSAATDLSGRRNLFCPASWFTTWYELLASKFEDALKGAYFIEDKKALSKRTAGFDMEAENLVPWQAPGLNHRTLQVKCFQHMSVEEQVIQFLRKAIHAAEMVSGVHYMGTEEVAKAHLMSMKGFSKLQWVFVDEGVCKNQVEECCFNEGPFVEVLEPW